MHRLIVAKSRKTFLVPQECATLSCKLLLLETDRTMSGQNSLVFNQKDKANAGNIVLNLSLCNFCKEYRSVLANERIFEDRRKRTLCLNKKDFFFEPIRTFATLLEYGTSYLGRADFDSLNCFFDIDIFIFILAFFVGIWTR